MYGYLYGYTIAQIELMAIDQPLVVYDHKKDKKKGGKREFEAPSKSAMDKAIARYKEMQRAKEESNNSNS